MKRYFLDFCKDGKFTELCLWDMKKNCLVDCWVYYPSHDFSSTNCGVVLDDSVNIVKEVWSEYLSNINGDCYYLFVNPEKVIISDEVKRVKLIGKDLVKL